MLRRRKEVKILPYTPNLSIPNHPLVTSVFPENIPILPNSGRYKCFLKNWAKLTSDPITFETVQGYNILYTV